MKILVGVKRVVDAYVRVRVKSDESGVDLTNTKMAINPFCEIAVEEAIRLKEAGHATEVIAVSVGPSSSQEQIRTALALGADRGIMVETEEAPEPLSVAKVLKAIVKKEAVDLVILGKQSIDTDNNQVGQMFAALCDMPQGTFACNAELKEGSIEVTREIDGGEQTVLLTLPAVVTTDLRLNEPRYASLPNIMKAKKKPIHVSPEDLGVTDYVKHQDFECGTPDERGQQDKVESVSELVEEAANRSEGNLKIMSTLVIAEHDNSSLKKSVLNTITAASAIGEPVDVLIAGGRLSGCCGCSCSRGRRSSGHCCRLCRLLESFARGCCTTCSGGIR